MFNQGANDKNLALDSVSLQTFTSHLGLLINCGFPLIQVLETLSLGDGALNAVCKKLAVDIFTGSSLSHAMSLQPRSFPEPYVNVVRVGEASGQLTRCLDRLAVTLEERNRLNKLLFGILLYPATLVLVCTVLMAFGIYGIFPMIIKVSADTNVELPALTKALLVVSSKKFLMLIGVLLGIVVGIVVAGLRSRRYGRLLRTLWEGFSPLGRFQVETRLVMCVRQLALLMECGIDLLRSLRLLRDIAGSSLLLKDAFFHLHTWIQEGRTLADGFAEHDVFPMFLTSMLAAGEESATTHAMLNRAADVMEEDLYRRAQTLAALAEPVLLGVLGIGVGTIMLATLLPIYRMVNL